MMQLDILFLSIYICLVDRRRFTTYITDQKSKSPTKGQDIQLSHFV